MQKNNVIITSQDKNLVSRIEKLLASENNIESINKPEKILDLIKDKKYDLFIFDAGSYAVNVIEFYRKLKRINEKIKVIILSSSNEIDAAVTAAKLGVIDFIRKPIDDQALANSINKALKSKEEINLLPFEKITNWQWLVGYSKKLNSFIEAIKATGEVSNDLLISTKPGIDMKCVYRLVHFLKNERRKLVILNLHAFKKSSIEEHFWLMIKEVLQERLGENVNEEDICGTLVLEGFESLEKHFQISLLEFINNRKEEAQRNNIDQEVRIVVPVYNLSELLNYIPEQDFSKFIKLDVPSFSERKEDFSILASAYINEFAEKYNKRIEGISFEALNLLSFYDYPGNYEELKLILKQAVLSCPGQFITLENIPLDFTMLMKLISSKVSLRHKQTLEEVRPNFEKELLYITLKKVKDDQGFAARFLDIPREVLTTRLEEMI